MSKIKVFKQVIDDLKNLTGSMEELYQVLEHNDTSETSKQETKPVVDKGESKTITLEDVRAVLAEKSRLGFTKEIKQIITDLGAIKLSDVNEKDYRVLIEKAEVLGND